MIRRAIALLGAVAILGLTVACDADASEAPEGAFYLEAEILIDSSGTGDLLAEVSRQPSGTGLRWWSRDPEHYRHAFYDPDQMLEWGPKWTVADGEDVTFFDPRLGSYQRWSLAESGFAGLYPSFSVMFGPLPVETIDEFIEQWRANVDTVERVGTEELLGRTVEVVEYGPTWSSGSEESGGVGRLYIDTETGFILRHEVEGGVDGQSYSAEVTLLDLDPEFEDATFEADLPSGAAEVQDSEDGCSSSGALNDGSGFDFATMPVRFTYVPEGWTSVGSGSSQGSGCQVMQEWSGIRRGEDLIAVSQQSVPPTGVPDARRDATPVAIGNLEGYRLTVEGYERLVWVQGEVIVTIESNAAPFEELLRIAESAE